MKRVVIIILMLILALAVATPSMAGKKPPKSICWGTTVSPSITFQIATKKGGKIKMASGKEQFYDVQGAITTTPGLSVPIAGSGFVTTLGSPEDYFFVTITAGLFNAIGYIIWDIENEAGLIKLTFLNGAVEDYPLIKQDCKGQVVHRSFSAEDLKSFPSLEEFLNSSP